MTDESFRIVVSAAVALAALAFIVQAGGLILLYRLSKRTQRLITNFIGDVTPILARIGTAFTTAGGIMGDARPQIKELTGDTVAISKSSRAQIEDLGNLLHDACVRARMRLDQIDSTVEFTVGRLEHAAGAVKRAAIKPVKEVSGLAAGLSATISTLVCGSQSRSPDRTGSHSGSSPPE
jgi:hypothetical protein